MNLNDLQALSEAYLQIQSLDESVEQLNELSNRKLRAYIKKSDKSHKEINKKWDQGTATEKEKLKSIGHEEGQRRAYKKLDAREEFESWVNSLVEEGYDLSDYTWDEMLDIYEAEGSYGETPKAYSAAFKTKMTAKRKPFLKKMLRRTNPAERKSSDSSRKGMTAADREEARAGAAHGSPRGHDYPSQGPGGVTKNPKKLRKQKAMGEFAKEDFDVFDIVLEFLQVEGYAETLEEAEWLMVNELDEEDIESILEAEGSYGKTPKAREAMGKLAISRREKPASEYSQKGEKTKKVKEIEKHTRRIDNGPDAGNRGKKSTKPRYSGMLGKSGRGKLDQDSRDYARDSDVEYTSGGHKPGPGTVTKNPKKLRKQKAMGEIDETFNTYEFVLSYLLDEGFASTEQAADKIILNMSEAWFEDIVEARRSEKEGKGSPEYRTASGHLVGQRAEKKRKGEMGGRHFWSGGEGGSDSERGKKKVKGAKADENKYTQHGRNSVFQGRTEKSGKYSVMQSRKRGSEMGSRFD